VKDDTPTLADMGITKKLSSRAQKLADVSEEKFESALGEWRERVQEDKERMTSDLLGEKAHVSHATGNNEWNTPIKYIEAARLAMGSIDTDPASSKIANQNVKAKLFFTADDNGLKKKWVGNVWMNPPYAQPLMSDFAEAIASKFEKGEIDQACVLVNNATETAWFQRIAKVASIICFPSGRIAFLDQDGKAAGAPLQGQAILYLGSSHESFIKAFEGFGLILWKEE
jgi:ParB family chromosome partitioning protein